MMKVSEAIPDHWTELLAPAEPLGLGLDLATTEKGTSNPSAIAVGQKGGGRFILRLIVSWKTADPDVTEAIVRLVLDHIARAQCRARRLSIDSSNEVFFATTLRKRLGARLPIDLVKGGEKLRHRGEEMNAKTLLGNLYASLLEDGLVSLPPQEFIALDHRLVKREAGLFVTDTGKGGQHGDTFDACKLAYWSLEGRGGPASFTPLPVGELAAAGAKPDRPGLVGRLKKRRGGGILA